MSLADQEIFIRLGTGESIDSICADADITRAEFINWWQTHTQARVPEMSGTHRTNVNSEVDIFRDDWGVPHIIAKDDSALFFGYGYAMAQDRLWQLDYYRRKAHGTLSEILGEDGLESDTLSRTIGIGRIAERGLPKVDAGTRDRLNSFAKGVTAVILESQNNLPIEFDLLGYRPKPWSALDSYAIWQDFRWYLTGRLPIIAIPELAKRVLGEGTLLDDFITGEAEDESIIPTGSYPTSALGVEKVGEVIGDPQDGLGSNNWVISGNKSANGKPIVASDPHIAFGAVSCWYEAHLSGPEFNVAGAGYAGVPGIVFGRNETLAWGVTNNICSQRDIYKEQEDPERPGWFRFGDGWEKAETFVDEIVVKDSDAVKLDIVRTRNGPIVTDLLPDPLKDTGPVTVKWVGASHGDEITCMFDLASASDCDTAREALAPWVVPTWSYVFGDVNGQIGYQACGRIPFRKQWNREYRPGWEPNHQWEGYIPVEGLPTLADPPSGYAHSANNRAAPEDFPYPLSGTWSSGYRARRIRQMLEESDNISRSDFAQMQMDTLSLRAADTVPELNALLSTSGEANIQQAREHLGSWDYKMSPDSVAATIYEYFFEQWTKTIAGEKFPEDQVDLVAGAISGFAVRLLNGKSTGYFESSTIQDAVLSSMTKALAMIEERLGSEMGTWKWGRIHTLSLEHLLSGRGEIADLLARGGKPVGGNGITVSNTGFDPNYLASIGANWRHNAELADNPPGLWAVDASGQSGHPGSPHYGDQYEEWRTGKHHYLPMDNERIMRTAADHLRLEPTN